MLLTHGNTKKMWEKDLGTLGAVSDRDSLHFSKEMEGSIYYTLE
jgi:hypothetical protein